MTFSPTTPFHIARGQEQKGPFPLYQVERMLTTGEALPTDLCWADGMDGWQPLQTIITPPPAEPEQEALNPYSPPKAGLEGAWVKPGTQRHYGGLRRLPYFAISFFIGALQNLIILSLGDDKPVFWIVLIMGILSSLLIVSKRLKNIGMDPRWCFLAIVPFVNIVFGFICLVRQEGYVETRTLDKAGRTTAWVLVTAFVVLIAAAAFLTPIPTK